MLPVYKTSKFLTKPWFHATFYFFTWVTDLSFVNYLARISAVLLVTSIIFFFFSISFGRRKQTLWEKCRVSVKFLFVRHHTFCSFPWPSIWNKILPGHSQAYKNVLSSFPDVILYFSSCFAFPYLKIRQCCMSLQNSTPITSFDMIDPHVLYHSFSLYVIIIIIYKH